MIVLLVFGLQAKAQFPASHGHDHDQQKQVSFPKSNQFSKSKLEYTIINSPNGTFGYDVLADGKLLIHQSSIPAMPGNSGFDTRQSAAKVAKLVIQKIKNGEMPPTVTVEELKKLKVISN